jgi:anaerobic nitric oxide reductase transcription regulator
VGPGHLPAELRPAPREAPASADASGLPYRAARAVFEEQYISALLARHKGSVAAAAKAAGMSRAHFYELLKKHGMDLARFSGG